MSHDQSIVESSSSARLSTPSPPRHNGSFSNLAKLLKIDGILSSISIGGKDVPHPDAEVEDDDDEEDDDDMAGGGGADGEEVDEESLLWDGQAALIAHQPALAMERCKIAALPPYRSAAACLALGNLMTRGTGFTTSTAPSSPLGSPDQHHSGKGKGKEVEQPQEPLPNDASNVVSRLFTSIFPMASGHRPDIRLLHSTPPLSTPPERKFNLASNGWAIRKEGKRAVRDVEEMGVAGGWFVLGIGWILDRELERQSSQSRVPVDSQTEIGVSTHSSAIEISKPAGSNLDEDNGLVMIAKSKSRSLAQTPLARSATLQRMVSDASTVDTALESSSSSTAAHTITPNTTISGPNSQAGKTDDSINQEEQSVDGLGLTVDPAQVLETVKLLYDLLQPLLSLYRHGHIQAFDPVYLPPISSTQLPLALRPSGDLQKRRNAWALGAVVANRLLTTNNLRYTEAGVEKSNKVLREAQQRKLGVEVLANYIIGMTTSNTDLREKHFRAIVMLGPCGLRAADELVHQAAKRLDIIAKTPSEPSTPASDVHPSKDGYPFPQMTPVKRKSKDSKSRNNSSRHQSDTVDTLRVPNPPARRRRMSRNSVASIDCTGILLTPGKVSKSATKHIAEPSAPNLTSPEKSTSAVDMLRSVSAGSPESPALRSSLSWHNRTPSIISTLSTHGSTAPSPLAPIASSTSLVAVGSCTPLSDRGPSAVETLRNLDTEREVESENSQWPNLSAWTMKKSPPLQQDAKMAPSIPIDTALIDNQEVGIDIGKEYPSSMSTIRAIASSPNLTAHQRASTRPVHPSISSLKVTSKPSSASLLCPDQHIAAMDPTLAAAELASALTKHVNCSVCSVTGVNFPECRKCGMRFCSRDCRVGEKAAGNGKRHLCGVWESRKRALELEKMTMADHVAGRTPVASPVRVY